MTNWGGAEDINLLGNLGGTLGIIDPNKGNRSLAAMAEGQATANNQLDTDTTEQFGMLSDAMAGRSMGANLNAFDQSVANAQNETNRAGALAEQQANAGRSDNVQSYMNPQMEMMLNQTLQKVQGGTGSALQSSAATKAGANAVATRAGDLWQQAFNNAMGDSQNNLNVANRVQGNAMQNASLAGMQLQADNAPAEDYLQLGNDRAMQRYAGNIALTQAQAQNAGRDQSLLGSLLGGS